MAKNDSKITAKTAKAVPSSVKADASFTKRSFKDQKMDAGRKGPREASGPRTSANAGASVSDDNAGTKSRADLPPETTAMKAPPATLPDAVMEIAADVLPLPSADSPLLTVEPFDFARDRKLGRMGS